MEDEDRLAIRTPDQRLRVFVSSTLAELADERVAVARSISALRLTPVMFELGARPYPPQDLYRAYLAQSDIFVGIYWQRYGWVGPGMDISGLEDEFRLSGSLPRLLYVKSPAPDREPRLTGLIAEIETLGADAYRNFATTRELGRLIRDDLAMLLSERFAMSAQRGQRPAPAPIAASKTPRSLPIMSTSLIERDADIVTVANLLRSAGVRLVTLTGPGGIGKTRLAIAVGEELDKQPGLRTLFVPLAAITQPDLVLPHVAAIAGASIEGNRSPVDALIEHFADTKVLLIVDNVEQVVEVAPQLDQLLSSCPGLKILATSRTVLRLRAEREYVVAALMVPPFVEQPSMDQLSSLPAAQLFLDRARAVRQDFSLSEDNVAAVVEICRRLDGLPLAIELAAARTRLLRPVVLLTRLERVLDALGTGPVDLPERQRTLRATVEWSLGLLDGPERQLLATLSVFADGWTVAAAASVSEETEDRTLDLLDALAGHSLVSVDASGSVPRFRMLTSVRELAAEHLAQNGANTVIEQRHAAYFAGLIATGDWPTEQQTAWADRLRTEEQNLRAAIRWFFNHDITPLPHIFRALWLFWQISDRMPEGRAWIDELRVRTGELDDQTKAEVLFTWAVTSAEVGDDDSALAAVRAITGLQQPVDDPYLASALQLAIAWALPIVDDFEGALAAASKALAGLRQQNRPFAAFAALTVGMLEMTLGRDDTTREYLREVNELGGQFGNTWLTSTARAQLASLAVRTGQFDEARGMLIDTVDSIEDAHISTRTVTFALVAFAQLALAEGNTRQAAIALSAADGLRKRAGLLAWLLARRGEAELAARLAQVAGPGAVEEGRSIGFEMHHRDALALIRNGVTVVGH